MPHRARARAGRDLPGRLGINRDLAPVVDLGSNPANPVIVGAARSFGVEPHEGTEPARAFAQGLRP
jgi:beta-glucosidase-like glycosyl hydrolase